MNLSGKYTFYIGVVLLFNSCKEYFLPDYNSTESVISVDCLLSDFPSKQTINLSYARSFDERPYFKPVLNAQVKVYDQYNNVFYFYDNDNNGSYQSESYQFAVQSGVNYYLEIISEDGDIYRSTNQNASGSGQIDSLYFEYGTKVSEIIVNGSETSQRTDKGYWIMNNSRGSNNADNYFLYGWRAWMQYYFEMSSGYNNYYPFQRIIMPLGTSIYESILIQNANAIRDKKITSNKIFFLPEADLNNSFPHFQDSALHCTDISFIYEDQEGNTEYHDTNFCFVTVYDSGTYTDTVYGEYKGNPYFWPVSFEYVGDSTNMLPTTITYLKFAGMQLKLLQYSVSYEVYNYYNSILEQQKATNRMYDPVVSQIESNITCVNNDSKRVCGYFAISSASVVDYFLYIDKYETAGKKIERFPEKFKKDYTREELLEYWIYQ